jgi:hypothetical protein
MPSGSSASPSRGLNPSANDIMAEVKVYAVEIATAYALWMRSNGARYSGTHEPYGRAESRDRGKERTALLPAPFWCTYAWNRPTSTRTGGSDPLWLCWRGKPWLAIRWRGYAAFKRSQLELQSI